MGARTRIEMLLAVSATATALTLGSGAAVAGAKQSAVGDWAGPTSASQGYVDVSFEAQTASSGKAGRKARLPFRVKKWIMGAPQTCSGAHLDEVAQSGTTFQFFPGYVAGAGNPQDPGIGNGPKLPVRNGAFSDHGVYNVLYYFIPKRIEFTMSGRFTGPRTATGTLEVSSLLNFSDGGQATCDSGSVTWSACRWDPAKQRPACAGIDPTDTGPPIP